MSGANRKSSSDKVEVVAKQELENCKTKRSEKFQPGAALQRLRRSFSFFDLDFVLGLRPKTLQKSVSKNHAAVENDLNECAAPLPGLTQTGAFWCSPVRLTVEPV